jgi:DNA ligase (NAD+)
VGQLKERLKYFTGRGQMDIEHLGTSLIEQLVDTGLVKNFADLYKLKKIDLVGLERMAEKSAANVINAIEKSKIRPLWRFIAALGIRHIGGQSAQILAQHFGSLEKIISAEQQELSGIDQIGPTMAKSIYEYFQDEKNISVIKQFLDTGVTLEKPAKASSDKISGRTVVITGTLENFTRQQVEEKLKLEGYKVTSSVSKKTDFVLAGKNPGSKLEKALSLGVKVIDEKEFLDILNN